jgi:hypothetical protein
LLCWAKEREVWWARKREREREEGRWCVLLSTVLSERDGGGSVVG